MRGRLIGARSRVALGEMPVGMIFVSFSNRRRYVAVMLHREDSLGLIVITQPAHAWISGQMARAPTLNPQTGRPHSFLELSVATHTEMWLAAGPCANVQGGRFAALMVSLHGSGLYARRDLSADSPADAQVVREYLAHAHAFEAELIEALRGDAYFAPHVTDAALARNRRLIAVWDYLSLLLCMGLRSERTLDHVPAADGEAALTLTPRDADGCAVEISPWPFRQNELRVHCEARRLAQEFSDEAAMRQALAAAPQFTLEFMLRPK